MQKLIADYLPGWSNAWSPGEPWYTAKEGTTVSGANTVLSATMEQSLRTHLLPYNHNDKCNADK